MVRYLWAGLLVAAAPPMRAQDSGGMDHSHMDHAAHHRAMTDSAFQALQQRGGVYMGVDQTRSAHRFDSLDDGGRIELVSTTGDSADVAAIRRHFQVIAGQFRQGDFTTPFAVHADTVPGTKVMRERRAAISYDMSEVPGGAQLRLKTADQMAIAAIHQFMAYQRAEHHSPGQE
ncbi:MAG TPA: hypothetical protein VLD58_15965 [Gemmatimonadales bacterium]|nr:hypothetical protein [Gemmatimonadales bacterium]